MNRRDRKPNSARLPKNMKVFEYEYSYNNNPDTRIIWIQGESAEQIAEILSRYFGDPVAADDLTEYKTETVEEYIRRGRIKAKDVMKVVQGELV